MLKALLPAIRSHSWVIELPPYGQNYGLFSRANYRLVMARQAKQTRKTVYAAAPISWHNQASTMSVTLESLIELRALLDSAHLTRIRWNPSEPLCVPSESVLGTEEVTLDHSAGMLRLDVVICNAGDAASRRTSPWTPN